MSSRNRSIWRGDRCQELVWSFLNFRDRLAPSYGTDSRVNWQPDKTRSRVLVVSGRDATAVSDVIKQLQPSRPLPDDGVVVTID